MKAPTGYLDTNLVSGLVKEDLREVELDALRELLRLRKAGQLTLRTSRITHEELRRLPEAVRARHEDIYLLLDDIPGADEQVAWPTIIQPVVAGRSRIIAPPVIEDAELALLRTILPDPDDARHVFQAARSGVDYFITCDEKTLVRYAEKLRSAVGISVCLPSQLLAELTAAGL